MKTYEKQNPAYDVSGGDTNFEKVQFSGVNFLGIQLFYTSLNQVDHKIRLQESIDGNNFVDSLDGNGNTIEMVIDNTLITDILNVAGFNTAFYRLQFIEGTTGTGIIDNIKYLME